MVFTWLNLAILAGLAMGVAFAAGPLAGSVLLAPSATGGDLRMPYECGVEPHGVPWIRFGINYYFYALLFLAFDVDVLYLFPVAAAYSGRADWAALIKVVIFLGALGLGVLYFARKGVFTWPRKIS